MMRPLVTRHNASPARTHLLPAIALREGGSIRGYLLGRLQLKPPMNTNQEVLTEGNKVQKDLDSMLTFASLPSLSSVQGNLRVTNSEPFYKRKRRKRRDLQFN